MLNESDRRRILLATLFFFAVGFLALALPGEGLVLRVAGGVAITMALVGLAQLLLHRRRGSAEGGSPAESAPAAGVDGEPNVAPTPPEEWFEEVAAAPEVDDDAAAPGVDGAAIRRTLDALTEAGALRRLTEAETARVIEGAVEAASTDLPILLATIDERAGLRAGDPVSLANDAEEDDEYFRSMIEDFGILAGRPIEIDRLQVDWPAEGRIITVRADLRIAGRAITLNARSWTKYIAPAFPVRLARALRESGAPRRLAAYTLEDMWVLGLADGPLDGLNAAVGLPDPYLGGELVWLDAEEPEEAS